ncbi:type IV toxin-antitoxin system AbiEi family antitoxin domain-containing protein [Streptomyces sp. RKAG337]|uniref:type IV toxin-antitoxin system AbiEi family antitoxin domain-containing protein n=1 Tax=Streptomyces sp. RKAG337 TaxID=2893404 RepID=UPI0020339F47|nr:type IV toxin-antitoxin system AbiEi family antitoxin domain-containing protein [Streptomyces sp. RKAG337]MCM2427992.1 type IV toxin-antitoxin system AbiEi family antitoxin domain-containing protein [Streptomyces sp. RKAG337]
MWDTVWTAVSAVATALALLAVAWQPILTRRALGVAHTALTVSEAVALDAARARLDDQAPEVTVVLDEVPWPPLDRSVCIILREANAALLATPCYYCCMDRHEALKTLNEIAADQWGLVTTAQAEVAGVSRVNLARLASVDLLHRAGRSVYQVSGATPTAHLAIKVAWLRLNPAIPAWQRDLGDEHSGVVSHASACQLHDLGDIPADAVQISVPRRRTTREPAVVLHQVAVPVEDITMVDGLPVTTVERTICDLLKSRADAGHVGRILAEADQQDLIDTRTLAARVRSYTHFYGLPRNATGTDLLETLAEQAGFLLRDQQLATASRQGAVASALAYQTLLHEIAIPTSTARALQEAAQTITLNPAFMESVNKIVSGAPAMQGIQEAMKAISLNQEALHNQALSRSILQALQEATRGLTVLPPSVQESLRNLAMGGPGLQALQEAMRSLGTHNFSAQGALSTRRALPTAEPVGGEPDEETVDDFDASESAAAEGD